MNEKLVERVRSCPSLPSLPAIAVQVLQIAQSPEADIAAMAKLITQDPALSSKILKTVNSSFYARAQPVATISQSLVVLGLQSVKTLVLGFSLVTNLKKPDTKKKEGFDHMAYWKRSVYAATAARIMCAKIGVVQHEEAFLATLLADIGELVLDQVLGAEYGQLVAAAANHSQLLEAERTTLQLTHADVGGMLTEAWKLPPLLSIPVANHHSPEVVNEPALRKLAELVSIAGQCADVFVDEAPAQAIQVVRASCQPFGLAESDVDALLSEIGGKTREIAGLFEINIGAGVPYEQILKRANEALVEITLSSQMQATQLAQQANTLAQQNEKLKEAAVTDALTGLGNRERFNRFLTEQFDLAKSTGTHLSLILIDLDHFKKVNDTHGHPAGDAVLKAVARILRTAARSQDVACRYGGEEMALIMPATSRATAAATAETIRRTISARPIPLAAGVAGDEAVQLPITASLGVASTEPGSPIAKHEHLLKATDMALYNAKHGGRNAVKVFAPAAKPATAAA